MIALAAAWAWVRGLPVKAVAIAAGVLALAVAGWLVVRQAEHRGAANQQLNDAKEAVKDAKERGRTEADIDRMSDDAVHRELHERYGRRQ